MMHFADDVFNISTAEREMEFSGFGARGDHNYICPSAVKLFDQSSSNSIEIMIEKAKYFHQRGGNLVSIENYLNGQMQNTLDKQDLKFKFNKNINQQPLSTDRTIHDLNLYY
jgi:hypothetical protein